MLTKEALSKLAKAYADLEQLSGNITSVRNRLGPSAADDELGRVLKEAVSSLHGARHKLAHAIGLVTMRS